MYNMCQTIESILYVVNILLKKDGDMFPDTNDGARNSNYFVCVETVIDGANYRMSALLHIQPCFNITSSYSKHRANFGSACMEHCHSVLNKIGLARDDVIDFPNVY